MNKTIEIAKSMKSKFMGNNNRPVKIVMHPGGISQFTPIEDVPKLYLMLEEFLSNFSDKDVELLAENMPPMPWYFGGQWCHSYFMEAEEIVEFCEKYNRKICFDVSHAQLYCNKTAQKISNYIKLIKPYIRHIHLADAAGWDGEGLQIDEGEVDFKNVLSLLNDLDVINIIEIWQGHKFDGEGFRTGLQRLNNYWKNLK